MNKNEIINWISEHESSEPKVYLDSKGIATVGVGFNLEKDGAKEAIENLGLDYDKVLSGNQSLSEEQINNLLQHDVDTAIADAQKIFSNFDSLPEDKQLVLVDMSYNLGFDRLSGFHEMIHAVEANDWSKAADEMVDSKWFDDVKNRGEDDVNVMRNEVREDLPMMHELHESSLMLEHNSNEIQPIGLTESNLSDSITLYSEVNNEVLLEQSQNDNITTPAEATDILISDEIQLNQEDNNNTYLIIEDDEPNIALDNFISSPGTIIDTESEIIIDEQNDFIVSSPFNSSEVLINEPFYPIIEEPIDILGNIPTAEYDLNTLQNTIEEPVIIDYVSNNWDNVIATQDSTEFQPPISDVANEQILETEASIIPTYDIWTNDSPSNSPIENNLETPTSSNWINDEPSQNVVDHSFEIPTTNYENSANDNLSNWGNDDNSSNSNSSPSDNE